MRNKRKRICEDEKNVERLVKGASLVGVAAEHFRIRARGKVSNSAIADEAQKVATGESRRACILLRDHIHLSGYLPQFSDYKDAYFATNT